MTRPGLYLLMEIRVSPSFTGFRHNDIPRLPRCPCFPDDNSNNKTNLSAMTIINQMTVASVMAARLISCFQDDHYLEEQSVSDVASLLDHFVLSISRDWLARDVARLGRAHCTLSSSAPFVKTLWQSFREDMRQFLCRADTLGELALYNA
ncbi:hypothetical protein J6590_046888 [Homalodisca vitripennis]|nr:hypothetical protein J6590_046888 [Homalodisca vitripennis]